MPTPRSTSLPSAPTASRRIPVASIVALVAKGMTARQILAVFPDLEPDDVRSALLRAAEVVQDQDRSLRSDRDSVLETVKRARATARLSEAEALKLALEETRATRRARVARRMTKAR